MTNVKKKDALVEKGLVTKEEVLKRIEKVVDRFERGMFPGWVREVKNKAEAFSRLRP